MITTNTPFLRNRIIFAAVANVLMLAVAAYSTGTSDASTPFAGFNSSEARVIEFFIYEDGSGSLTFDNGTRISFLHEFIHPLYLFDNQTIHYNNQTSQSNNNDDEEVLPVL